MLAKLLTLLEFLITQYKRYRRDQELLEHQRKVETLNENPAEFLADHFGTSGVRPPSESVTSTQNTTDKANTPGSGTA